MSKSKNQTRGKASAPSQKSPSLKQLAEYLGLAPATVSFVMNGSAMADTIAPETRKLILAAAQKLGYRPNFFARCLRTQRSFTIGVIVPEASAGYNVTVLCGIEEHLLRQGYFYLVASHHFDSDLISEYTDMFLHRSVDGLIIVNTPWQRELSLPAVTVSSHHRVHGITRMLLDHDRAAELGLRHLAELGHRKIAVIKGQPFVPDTSVRWDAIARTAGKMGMPIPARLVRQIEENSPSSYLGYKATQELLVSGEAFTALFAFNDICALGAIRALHEFGLRVPEDVSVLGFDDIESAAYQTRGLSTIRQPLREMGEAAARTLLLHVSRSPKGPLPEAEEFLFQPELVVRETTAPARTSPKASKKRGTGVPR